MLSSTVINIWLIVHPYLHDNIALSVASCYLLSRSYICHVSIFTVSSFLHFINNLFFRFSGMYFTPHAMSLKGKLPFRVLKWLERKLSWTSTSSRLPVRTAPITWASDRWSDDRGAVSTVPFRCRSRTGQTPDLDWWLVCETTRNQDPTVLCKICLLGGQFII